MQVFKKAFFLLLLAITANPLFAQQDTQTIIEFELLREKAQDLVSRKTDSAAIYADQLMQIAKASKLEQLQANALSTLSLVKLYQGKPDEALQLNQQSFEINKKTKNGTELAKNYYRFGTLYNTKSDFINAAKYFLQTLELSEKEKMYSLSQKCYRKLAVINVTQEKFKEALDYAEKAVATGKLSPSDNIDKAENLFTVATCYKCLKNIDAAERNYKEAYDLFAKEDYQMKMADVLSDMAAIYNQTNLIKSLTISLQARKIFDKIGPEIMPSINNLGNLGEGFYALAQNDSLVKQINTPEIPNTKEKLLNQAERYLIQSIEFSKKQDVQQAILYYSGLLSDIQAYKGDFKNAYTNLQFKFKYRDSLFSQENKNAIAKLESEKEILELKSINEKKSAFNKILTGSAIASILFSLLAFRNFKNRQKLQTLKITELEKDKQLLAIDAMLKGQEEERSRIAKDLHDGLGGMLSSVKLSFVNMKENMVMDAESVQSFENSIMQLDNTIRELRKVAHNLMPEALVRFGLKNAVLDFCNSMQVSSKTKIIFEQMGAERQLSNTADLYIYRIIQELINNAVKHSACDQILVQLTKTTGKILLTVEDDGKGFNTQQLQHAEGIGMKNIQQRVNYFKGKMDITSQPGEGTSVNIELTA